MSKNKLAATKRKAWSLVQENRFPEAIPLFRKACQINKNDVESWHALGGLYGQLGLFEDAEACCRRAIKIQPNLSEAHDNLGVALLEMGKAQEAVSCHQCAIRHNPRSFQAQFHLGNAYRAIEDYAHAETCYLESIKLNSNMVEAHNNLGNTLLQLERPEEAEQYLKKVIVINPTFPGVYENLARAQQEQGDLSAAISSLRTGLRYKPTSHSINLQLGGIYIELGKLNESVACLEKAIALKPDYFNAYGTLGGVLTQQGRLEEALRIYQHVLTLKPESPEAICAIADIYEKQGDYENAYKTLHKVIDEHPDNADIAISLGLLSKNITIDEEGLRKIEDVIRKMEYVLNHNDHLENDTYIPLRTLLGTLYDKTGQYDKAFHNYARANEKVRYPVDLVVYEQEINNLIEAFLSGFSNSVSPTGNPSNIPIFIVGMPRSGTTLVEQILCSHPSVYGAGELEHMLDIARALPNYPNCVGTLSEAAINSAADDYLEKLCAESDSAALRVTDKMPHNFLNLGLIQVLFPQASVIHCQREPIDTCLSCYFQNFGARHPYTNKLADLASYYKLYERMMQHWKDVLRIPILEIHYEDLIDNFEDQSRSIIEFCGLEWDDRCLRFHENKRIVKTASYSQVRKPIYKNSVGRWKNYEAFIEPLTSALKLSR